MTQCTDPNTWVSQYGDTLYRYALMRLRDPSLAEDIVQETFLAGIKSIDHYAGKSTEKTWLIGILKHKIIDHFRKSKHEQQTDELESVPDISDELFDEHGHWNTPVNQWKNPDQTLEQQEFWKVFSDCISNLPAHLADLFVLREISGLKSEDACKVLDISTTNNMWVMLSRARMRLRECLDTNWFNKE